MLRPNDKRGPKPYCAAATAKKHHVMLHSQPDEFIAYFFIRKVERSKQAPAAHVAYK